MRPRLARMLGGVVLVLGAVLASAAPAAAAQGSVPASVRAYVADGLVAQLADLYGPGAGGTGIDFDDTTAATAIWRVFGWSDAVLDGDAPDDPVVLRNEWAVPMRMGDAPLGLAVVWINPERSQPELAEFTAGADLATALAAVPDAAALVHDERTAAWLAVEAGTVTALVPGTSGVDAPVALADLPMPAAAPAPDAAEPSSLPLALAAVAGLVLIVVLALLIPARLKPRPVVAEAAEADAVASVDEADAAEESGEVEDAEPEPEPEPDPDPDPEPEPDPEPVPEPKPKRAPAKARTASAAKASTSKSTASKPSRPKPATPKTSARKPPAADPNG